MIYTQQQRILFMSMLKNSILKQLIYKTTWNLYAGIIKLFKTGWDYKSAALHQRAGAFDYTQKELTSERGVNVNCQDRNILSPHQRCLDGKKTPLSSEATEVGSR